MDRHHYWVGSWVEQKGLFRQHSDCINVLMHCQRMRVLPQNVLNVCNSIATRMVNCKYHRMSIYVHLSFIHHWTEWRTPVSFRSTALLWWNGDEWKDISIVAHFPPHVTLQVADIAIELYSNNDLKTLNYVLFDWLMFVCLLFIMNDIIAIIILVGSVFRFPWSNLSLSIKCTTYILNVRW